MFNIGGFKDIYLEVIQKIGMVNDASQLSMQVYMGIFDALIGVFLNSYCAGMYYRLSKAKGLLVGGSKVLLYMGILQCLFVISFVPGVIAIVVSVRLSKEEKNIANRPREEAKSELDVMSAQIAVLKQQLEKGEITQDQYDRALNDIIENSAKTQIFNSRDKGNNA